MTDTDFISGNKKELIASNAIQNVFASEIVCFDKKINQFVYS